MLPESDQLVSQTSYHVASIPSAAREFEEQKPSYFQRMITRSKQQLRSPEGQQVSIATPEDFVVGDSEDFPAIKTTCYFADYILSSERASSETLEFVNTIQQVRQGIGEATRLCVSPAVSNFLDAYPNKRTWAIDCLQEAQQTLNDIGTDMDSTWVREEDGGTVASKLKFEWGLKNQKKLLKRQQQLKQCHIHLMGLIHVLQTAELCSKPGVIIQEPIYEAPVRPMVLRDERDTLRGPYSRQKHRLGYNYASISSLTLALENDKDDFETASVNSTPVELEGSTPSELSENQNVHYVSGFQTSHERLTDSPSLFRRPRASSDYVRHTAISGVTSRASIDSMIGCHDSISSTSPNIVTPMVARRYRATSVDIQSHNVNHKPRTQPPHVLKNQPSLVDDLADPVLPNMEVKRLPIEERAVLSNRSGRPGPVNKSLTTDHADVGHRAMITPDMATTFVPQSMEKPGHHRNTLEELHPSGEEPEPTQKHVNLETPTFKDTCTKPESYEMFDDGADSTKTSPSYRSSLTSTSHPSVSSLTLVLSHDEDSVCRPSGQRPSQRKSKNKLPAEFSNTNKPLVEGTRQPPRFPPPPPMIVIDDACLPILATETELPEDRHEENTATSAFQQKLQEELETHHVAGSLERRTSVRPVELSIRSEQPINALPALRNTPSDGELEPLKIATNNSPVVIAANGTTASWLSESQEDLVGKKPMSAQAKRRAAHARRMHLAFGNATNT